MVTDGMTIPLCRRKSLATKVFTSAEGMRAVIFLNPAHEVSHHAVRQNAKMRRRPPFAGTTKSAPQYRDHAIGEGQAFGHYGDEIGQEFLAELRILALDRLELMRAQDIENAGDLGLDRRAARRMRDEAHFAD